MILRNVCLSVRASSVLTISDPDLRSSSARSDDPALLTTAILSPFLGAKQYVSNACMMSLSRVKLE